MIGSKAELDAAALQRIEDRHRKGEIYGGSEWQHKIKGGDNFVVYEQVEDIFYFCHVLTPGEMVTFMEGSDLPTRARDSELEVMRRIHQDGFRVVQAHSVLQTGGVVLDCHVARALVLLSDEEFEQMRDIGWDPAGYLAGKHPSKREVIVTLRPVERPTASTVRKIGEALKEASIEGTGSP